MDALIADAKKAYAVEDFDQAAELFSDACQAFSEKHGEDNPDLLFSYGRALFKVAMKNASLVNSEKVEEKQLPMENAHISLAAEEEANAEEEDSSQEGEDDQADEDDDDFTTAWQILDTCRLLYSKRGDEAKLAETYSLLGDVSIEDDNYPQAAEDFTSALELKKKLFPEDHRVLGEASYMLALAHELAGDKKLAAKYMTEAETIAKTYDPELAKDLHHRVHELEADLANKRDDSQVHEAANNIAGREAITDALTKMLTGASDISAFTRKRKRPAAAGPATKRVASSSEQKPEAKPKAKSETGSQSKSKPSQSNGSEPRSEPQPEN